MADVGLSRGFSAIAQLEQRGLIKRVVPLDRDAGEPVEAAGRRLLSAFSAIAPSVATGARAFTAIDTAAPVKMLAATQSTRRGSALHGMSLIELSKGADIDKLKKELERDDTIASVSRVPIRHALGQPARRQPPRRAQANPPPGDLWNLEKIRWKQARGRGYLKADGIKVAVLDTGIDENHPSLAGVVKSYRHERSGDQDLHGHGTHVAGTIAAKSGVNGVCRCNLHVWKVFSDTPHLYKIDREYGYVVDTETYLQALDDVIDEEMNVVNLSLGGAGDPDVGEAAAIGRLVSAGIIVVAAMGNEREYGNPTTYPSAFPDVIAVGSTGREDGVSSFSNAGKHVTVCAPGEEIWSTLPTYPGQEGWKAVYKNGKWSKGAKLSRETDFDDWAGTSMAAPHVTAAVAVYLARNPGADLAKVLSALEKCVDRPAGMRAGARRSTDYGWGRLNLEKLLS
jgi:subtilisin family serine protease